MNTTQIEQQLRADLKQAEEDLSQLEEILEDKPDFGLGTGGAGTQTWEMNLARKERLVEQIDNLQDALGRVEAGTYGVCENCGKTIDVERLEILPTTTLCTDCAQGQA